MLDAHPNSTSTLELAFFLMFLTCDKIGHLAQSKLIELRCESGLGKLMCWLKYIYFFVFFLIFCFYKLLFLF